MALDPATSGTLSWNGASAGGSTAPDGPYSLSIAGVDPYRRKVASFRTAVDRVTGATGVKVQTIDTDKTAFTRSYQPGNPAADATGYVLTPNVNTLVEAADMKAAQRSYEANLNAIEAAKGLTMRTIDLLK